MFKNKLINIATILYFLIRNQSVVFFSTALGRLSCRLNGVVYGKNLQLIGLPLVYRNKGASISLGDNVVLNSSTRFNLAGINHRVILAAAGESSRLSIGSGTGISGAVIHARTSIRIGNYVAIGANAKIFDHDFHSHNYLERRVDLRDTIKTEPIIIEDDVWIGADAIILKGVHIGRASIIGAGSVVTQDIPPLTLWAGNPAKFIKEIH